MFVMINCEVYNAVERCDYKGYSMVYIPECEDDEAPYETTEPDIGWYTVFVVNKNGDFVCTTEEDTVRKKDGTFEVVYTAKIPKMDKKDRTSSISSLSFKWVEE